MKKILAVLAISMLVLVWGAFAQGTGNTITQADSQTAFNNLVSGQVINQVTGLMANTGASNNLDMSQLSAIDISGNSFAGTGFANQTAINSLAASGNGHVLDQGIVDEIMDNTAADSTLTQFDANLLSVSGNDNIAGQEQYKSISDNLFATSLVSQTGLTNATVSGNGNNVFQAIGCAEFPTVQEQVCPDTAPQVVGTGDFGQQIYGNSASDSIFTQSGQLNANIVNGVNNDVDQNLMQSNFDNIAAASTFSQSAVENAYANAEVNLDLDQIKTQDIDTNTVASGTITQLNAINYNTPGVGIGVTGGTGIPGDED